MAQNKIIFLDFDGVINFFDFFKFNPWAIDQECLDKNLIAKINNIILETNAKVIVSSDWRHGRSVEELHNLLVSLGFIGQVIDKTIYDSPTLNEEEKKILDSCRADQISHAITKHNINTFVIIDDNDPGGLHDHLVLTNSNIGITDEDVIKAINILNKQ